MRSMTMVVLAAWLCLAGGVSADDSSIAQSPAADVAPADAQPADAQPADAQPAEAPPPAGPSLQPANYAPVICDPGSPGLRFLEVRGTGFDAWATQHLVGNVVNSRGVPQIQWGSVWVSPQGRLTLEVNLCADPFRNRPALPADTYTVSVGSGAGRAIAATSIALSPPIVAAAPDDETTTEVVPAPETAVNQAVNPTAPTPVPLILPQAIIPPTPTPLPTLALPAALNPTPTPGPRTGPGSREQPFPLGAPGMLADGWQLLVTGITPDAYTGIKAQVPSTLAPAADQRDYIVRIQATYLGQGTGVFSAMRLALLSATQITYDQIHNGCGIIPDTVPPNLVTSGGVTRGNVCFAVRTSDLNSLVLFDNQTTDADRLYFALK